MRRHLAVLAVGTALVSSSPASPRAAGAASAPGRPHAPAPAPPAGPPKPQGYVTAAMGKWGLGPPGSEGDPLKQGFDHFFGYNCQRQAHNYYPTYLYDDDRRVAR